MMAKAIPVTYKGVTYPSVNKFAKAMSEGDRLKQYRIGARIRSGWQPAQAVEFEDMSPTERMRVTHLHTGGKRNRYGGKKT